MDEGESGQSCWLPVSFSMLLVGSISEQISPASLIGLGNRRRRHQLDSFVFCKVGVGTALVISRDESTIKSLFMFKVKWLYIGVDVRPPLIVKDWLSR